MLQNHIVQNFIQSPVYAATTVIGFLAIFWGLFLLRKSSIEFRDSVMKNKELKQKLINEITNDLDTLKANVDKLLNQKKIVGTFSFESISNTLNHIHESEKKITDLKHLEDANLNEQIASYLSFQRKLLSELKELEERNYENQKEYQEMVIFYNREYARFSQHVVDEDALKEAHKKINTELKTNRQKVLNEMTRNSNMIDKYYDALAQSMHMHRLTIEMVTEYKEKNIKTKRFYLKQLSYV